MTLRDPAQQPCADPAATLPETLTGSREGAPTSTYPAPGPRPGAATLPAHPHPGGRR